MALVLGIGFGVAATALLTAGILGLSLLIGISAVTALVAVRLRQQHLAEEMAEPLDMVDIPGGTFNMGSPEEDDQAYDPETPQHAVTVLDFLMARYPVTRKHYRQVTGQRASEWRWYEVNPRLPANYVSWFDAVAFCNALSEQQGLRPCDIVEGDQVPWGQTADGYRLPTQAEWEYAARAGTKTRWFCGDEPTELG